MFMSGFLTHLHMKDIIVDMHYSSSEVGLHESETVSIRTLIIWHKLSNE